MAIHHKLERTAIGITEEWHIVILYYESHNINQPQFKVRKYPHPQNMNVYDAVISALIYKKFQDFKK